MSSEGGPSGRPGTATPSGGPVRVVHVIGGGDTGGAMSHLLPLLDALVARGANVGLVCLGDGGLAERARGEGLPVTVVPMRHAWDPAALPRLAARLAEGGPDVIHSHGMRANLPVRLLRALGRLPGGSCLVTTVHSDLGLDYPPAQAGVYGLLDRLSLPLVDRRVFVSRELAGRSACLRDRDTVVASGLSPQELSTLGEIGEEAGGGPVLGTVARMVAVKDLGLFLEAFAAVLERVPGAIARVVGEGPERATLERRSRELGLDGRVELPGEVRPVARALAGFDVYLVTSLSEGLPMSVLEAMAAGLPVVAVDVGGLREAVVDGVTGVLVPRTGDRAATAAGLADAVVKLVADPGRRRRMGRAARDRAVRRFSADRAAAETLEVYQSCRPRS